MLATAQQRSCCIGGKKATFTRAAGVRAVRPSVHRRGQRSVVVEARVSFFRFIRPPLQTRVARARNKRPTNAVHDVTTLRWLRKRSSLHRRAQRIPGSDAGA